MDINKILELNQLAKEEGGRYPRRRQPYFGNIAGISGDHFVGIVGARGAGKTVILKQIANQTKDSFYISVDALEGVGLFELAKQLSEKYGAKLLLIDEIHFQKNFEGELKQIFDFLHVKVIFTSSVALAIVDSVYDLSRRVQLITLYPFSFREYILFAKNETLSALELTDIMEKKWSGDHLRFGYLFEDYLKGGLCPFLLGEPDPAPLLRNILQKIVHKDIPQIARLHTEEPAIIEKMLEFIGRSEVDGINYSSLSKNLGITKYKAEQYVGLLKKSFVLNTVFPHGTNVLKEPKVLMCLPYRTLFKPFSEAIGALREDFFVEAAMMAGIDLFYLKSNKGAKTPDYLIRLNGKDVVMEVGGKGKGRSQFKDIDTKEKFRLLQSDDIDGNVRPLSLVGYLKNRARA